MVVANASGENDTHTYVVPSLPQTMAVIVSIFLIVPEVLMYLLLTYSPPKTLVSIMIYDLINDYDH